MRLVHMSDTHLGYKQYNLDIREQDIYDAFNQAVDIAIEERTDVIIHAGDLFDTPRPPIKALYTLKNALRKLNNKIKFLAVLGEHDLPKRRAMIPHNLFNIHVLGLYDLDQIEIDGVLFAGISNIRGKAVDHLKQEIKKFESLAENKKSSVLVLHQALKKYLPFEGAYQLTMDDLPTNASYYALGHIHSRQIEDFGNGKLTYCGSTEIFKKDEISSWAKKGKGIYLVDLDDEVTVEPIDIDIRPQLDLKIESTNIDIITEAISLKKKPVVHLEVFGENIDKVLIYKRIQDLLIDKVVTFRPVFRDTSFKEFEIPKGPIDFNVILNEYFNDEQLAEFALNLFEALSSNDVNEAIALSKNFLDKEVL